MKRGFCEKQNDVFHPDCTVGIGISPIRPLSRFMGFTTGGEFHSALNNKIISDFLNYVNFFS